jgi:hypothetical protein
LTPPTTLYPQDGNALAVWVGLTQSPAQNSRILTYLKRDWTPIGAVTPEWDGGKGIHPFPGGIEVLARLEAGDDENALSLIRAEWGYMLNSPIGTGSTFWEGYHTDGDFAGYYNGQSPDSYTSLAHGWATGPTMALTQYVLGVGPDGPGGQTYHVIPHPGDLTHAEGRLTMNIGPVDVAWNRSTTSFDLTVRTTGETGSAGVIAVPRLGADRVVTINGKLAWNGTRFLASPGVASADQDGSYIYFRSVAPGTRTFSWLTR